MQCSLTFVYHAMRQNATVGGKMKLEIPSAGLYWADLACMSTGCFHLP